MADAVPLATTQSGSTPSTSVIPQPVGAMAAASSSSSASVPGGVSALPAELTTLLHGDTLSPGLLVLGLLVAAGLGALHALTPGHGKTIMAAYLVGTRGDTRQAIGLGATVATSHTIGVLVLAMLVLAASSLLPPERLFPVLSAVSAILVTGIGGWLLIDAWRRIRLRREHGRRARATDAHVDHDTNTTLMLTTMSTLMRTIMSTRLRPRGAQSSGRRPASRTQPRRPSPQPSTAAHDGRADPLARHRDARAGGRPRALGLRHPLAPRGRRRRTAAARARARVAFGLGMASVLGAVGLVLVRARSLADRLPSMAADGRLGLVTSLAAATVVLGFGLLLVSQSLTALPF